MTKVLECLTAGFLALLATATIAQRAQDQPYPSQPVKLVVSSPPGGPNDVMARLLAPKLTASLGGSFLVENRRALPELAEHDVCSAIAGRIQRLQEPESIAVGNLADKQEVK